jgi:peptidoglycan/xylan/chitin deacetylase (PgdA/CDA1 family)
MSPVPVFAYHHVNVHKGDMVTVVPEVFEKQMRFLRDAGYRTLRAGELLSYINGEISLDEKAVMITFDDGWLDNYVHAFPILKKYNINASIFLATDWIDKASENTVDLNTSIPVHKESFSLIERNEGHKVLLNWELVREMSGSGLVEFHSHTKSHGKCHNLSAEELEEELAGSKRIIEERLGRPCTALCWPFGRNNDLAVKIARENGYSLLFTTRHGIVEKGSDPYAINRIAVKDSVLWFRKSMIMYTNNTLSKIYLRMKKK